MKHSTNPRRKQRGVTLLENMIALVILSVGLLGLAGLQAYTIRGSTGTGYRFSAMHQAQDIADRIRANLSDVYAATSNYDGIVAQDLTSVSEPTPNCSNGASNICNAAQLATFDAYQWQKMNNGFFSGDLTKVGGYVVRTNVNDINDQPLLLWRDRNLLDAFTPPARRRFIITMVWDGDRTGSATTVPSRTAETCPEKTSSDFNCYKLVVDL